MEAETILPPHHPACNYWTKPIGSPGCLCIVVNRNEWAALQEKKAERKPRGWLITVRKTSKGQVSTITWASVEEFYALEKDEVLLDKIPMFLD